MIEPMRIQFQPYTSEQITAILKRLISPVEKEALRRAISSTTDFKPLFQPLAFELCAKKVANASGDLRRALDLFRQAVNIAETEATSDTLVQITAVHIIKAEQASAGSPVIKTIKALPPNAQVLMAAILHLVSKKAPLVVSQLYEEYSRICKDSGLFEALSINEVGALLDNLETNGLVERNIDSKGFKGALSRRAGVSSIKGRSPSLSLLIVESDLWKALKANDLVCTIIPPEKKT